ncbi:hypothetical protein V1477_010469 [Vespula maculifrons]|uniref:Uncharacterized protein n=1 Tax=Vespula maculifrons TaxID=7453 RepID=A0ABD2CAV1_VESMC
MSDGIVKKVPLVSLTKEQNVKLIFSLAVTFAKDNDGSSLEKTNGRSVGMRDKDQERDREREK